MMSYRMKRRSFLAAVGGALGYHALLNNLEASAAGATSPPRFLMMHWPVGTVRYNFVPSGGQTDFTMSRILQPFEDAGLRDDLSILYGLTHRGINAGGGGGHEAGTPMMSTGAHCPGTRRNGGEADDAAAGGPSWDQILLRHIAELQRPGTGYVNAICDARVDSLETSTQCLSYGYTTRAITAERPVAGGMITENIPLLPTLSPIQLYLNLFSGFMPGGDTPGNQEELRRALLARKSVLDYASGELARVRTLAPAGERAKIELHEQAVRSAEMELAAQLENGTLTPACTIPEAPPDSLKGQTGSRFDYDSPETSSADDPLHADIGRAHMAIIRAAFQCDLVRVATFQFSPGTNHVSFGGLFPDDPNAVYMHHPLSHRITNPDHSLGSPPSGGEMRSIIEFLTAVHTWYNQRMAEMFTAFKETTDAFGGNLLDHTVIPCITEVAETTHQRSPLPALIVGGRALGMRGGQYLNFESRARSSNDFWLTIAQAYFQASNPVDLLGDEIFFKDGVSAIEGLWAPPG